MSQNLRSRDPGTVSIHLTTDTRVAALMASELGVETHSMQKALETHVRAHLAELTEVKAEFR